MGPQANRRRGTAVIRRIGSVAREDRKLLFHHIPKTGGSTLVEALRAGGWFEDLGRISGFGKTVARTHLPFSHEDNLPGYLHLTILRDPIERIVSWVRWFRLQRSDFPALQEAQDLARRLPMSMFLQRADLEQVRVNAMDRMVRQLGGDSSYEVSPTDETLDAALDVALGRLDRMFWIGHTETLDADMARLFDMLYTPNPHVDRYNVGAGPDDPGDMQVLEGLTRRDRRLVDGWGNR